GASVLWGGCTPHSPEDPGIADHSEVVIRKAEELPSEITEETEPVQEPVSPQAITRKIDTDFHQHPIGEYEEMTVLLEVRDVRNAARWVTGKGGKIVYDPNLGIGSEIPFLVVTLPPERFRDREFIRALRLRDIQFGDPVRSPIRPVTDPVDGDHSLPPS